MKSASKVLIAASVLFAFSANAGEDGRRDYRRLDCRFYADKKCDEGKKCDDEKKCDDGKKCDEPKKCDDPKKCGDGRKAFDVNEALMGSLGRPKFCYASATYWISDRREAHKVHFGVGCDRQTIYDNSGTIEPQEMVADHIRPRTAATPLVELKEQGDLRNPGSYTAKLEIDSGILLDGHCYVTDAREEDDHGRGLNLF